jgi:flavin-binding protein dodecin
MADSVYKVIELVGTSTKSWEDAAKAAVDRAGKSLRDLRVAEVVQLDMQMDKGRSRHTGRRSRSPSSMKEDNSC